MGDHGLTRGWTLIFPPCLLKLISKAYFGSDPGILMDCGTDDGCDAVSSDVSKPAPLAVVAQW